MTAVMIAEDIEDVVPIEKYDERMIQYCKDFKENFNGDFVALHQELRKKYGMAPSKRQIRNNIALPISPELSHALIKRSVRSKSGVLVSTIVLEPGEFSCRMNCSYCPIETDRDGNQTQPRSYVSTEPAMLRATQYNFSVSGQFNDRVESYINTGNIELTDTTGFKFEIIISGGTFEHYSLKYREMVFRELYYAANICRSDTMRDMLELEEEIKINETALFRIIGITIETRPDNINISSVRNYRRWGVTRVQLGVQHYDDDVLNYNNRECPTSETIRAIKLLKSCGFKIVCHLMPDLPGSNKEKDLAMFKRAITDPDVQFDDVKIYPTAVCKSPDDGERIVSSQILDWYNDGKYMPYSEVNMDDLIEVLMYYKLNIPVWVRIQRLVRDIPTTSIESGYGKVTHLRQKLQDDIERCGKKCLCLRCMEVGHRTVIGKNAELVVNRYIASGGIEYHISVQNHVFNTFMSSLSYLWYLCVKYIFGVKHIYWSGNRDSYNALLGFCRLRIDSDPGVCGKIRELEGCALLRELHVYGKTIEVSSSDDNHYQHTGIGKRMMDVAEDIARRHGFKKMAVIAGVGAREYYRRKCGYELVGTYMIKDI